jgi:hypothetical protein
VQSNFAVEVHDDERAVVIGVSGELDLASSPELERELERGTSSSAELLIIDLGKQLAVVKGPQQVQRLLSLTGVAERLTVVDAPEELLAGS